MRRIGIVAFGALLAALAIGCGGGGDSKGGVVQLTFWHGQSQATAKQLDKLIDQFNRTHPKIHVSKDSGGVLADDMLTKVTAGLASGSYPDIAYIFGPDLASIARSPKVVDLTDVVKRPDWGWGDFWAPERQATTVDGRVRAVPALADVLAVIYNKKIFQGAQVAPPTDTTSWEQFRELAKRTTDPGKGISGTAWPGVGGEDTVWRLWPMVWQQGGEILAPDGRSVGFNNASGLNSLSLIHDMAVTDKSVYVDPDPSSDRTGQLFQNGKLAMWLAGPWALLDVKQAHIDAGVSLLPGFSGNHTSIAGPDNWVIFDNGSERSRAAVEFVRWLTAPAQDIRFAEVTGQLPLRRSTTKLPAFAAYARNWPGIPTFVKALTTARVRPTIKAYPRMSEAVGRGIVSVMLGQASPADALRTMSNEANSALASG